MKKLLKCFGVDIFTRTIIGKIIVKAVERAMELISPREQGGHVLAAESMQLVLPTCPVIMLFFHNTYI